VHLETATVVLALQIACNQIANSFLFNNMFYCAGVHYVVMEVRDYELDQFQV
jgi:hypothetical protein